MEFNEVNMDLIQLLFVIIGLLVGSFLNVCISRIPLRKSVIFPRSTCPSCSQQIKFYDNIPIISFVFLGGRCRLCKERIFWQYPVVEILTGTIFWITYLSYGGQVRLFVLLMFFSALIVLIFIDLNERILPNIITLPGILVGTAFSFWIPIDDPTGLFVLKSLGISEQLEWRVSFTNSLLGIIFCAGFFWLVAGIYLYLRKSEGMGGGDIKLMGMIGGFLGVKVALLTIMLGSILGTLIGLSFIKIMKKDIKYELPFGSFLGAAAIVSALWGQQIISWYSNLVYSIRIQGF